MNEREVGIKRESMREALGGFRRALINIDYTNDFVAIDGALTAGEPAQLIEDAIVDITKEATEKGDFVVYAIDYHKEDDQLHPETKLFPPHNIEGTKGRELYGKLGDLYLESFKNSNVYYLNKTRYSAFVGTDLEQKLRERDIKVVDLVGVCTDICVLHTAIDAYNKGFKVRVHQKAVASFNPAGHEYALGHMKGCLDAEIL